LVVACPDEKGQGETMRCLQFSAIVAGILIVAAIGLSAVQAAAPSPTSVTAQAQGQSQWRYTFRNGEWWYWLPSGRWVYWRCNRWNDYNPRTFTACPNPGPQPDNLAGLRYGGRAPSLPDIGPFYGRTFSTLYSRPVQENGEVGPFYGHAMPSEVFGNWQGRFDTRPFYGRVVPSSGN
jgi:hypothetical protein